MLFIFLQERPSAVEVRPRVDPAWSLGLLFFTMFLPEGQFALSVPLAVAATALLIATMRPNTRAAQVLSNPKTVHLGRISYSLYLWHWPVIVVSRWTVGLHWWLAPAQLLLMWGLAELSYRYIEKPFRRPCIFEYRTIAAGLASIALVSAVLFSARLEQLYLGQRPRLAASGPASLANPYHVPQQPSSVWQGKPCVLTSNSEVGKAIHGETCTLGNQKTAKHRILAVGNSSAAAFVPAFDDIVRHDEYAVTITAAWSASPLGGIPNHSEWSRANDYYWQHVVPPLIATLKPGDWVFLMSDLTDFSPQSPTLGSAYNLRRFEDGLTALARDLQSKRIRLAVLHGLPFMHEAICTPAMAAPQWFAPFGRPCTLYSKGETLTRRNGLHDMLIKLQNRGYLTVVDLMPVFCADEVCGYYSHDGIPLYRDEWGHTSVEAARLSGRLIRAHLAATEQSSAYNSGWTASTHR